MRQPAERSPKTPTRSHVELASSSGVVAAAGVRAEAEEKLGAGGGTVGIVDGGGPVLTTADVYLIFWGSAWAGRPTPSADEVAGAVSNIFEGAYMSSLLQYRSVGHSLLRGRISVTASNPPSIFTDSNVVLLLQSLLDGGTLPEPDRDSRILYVVVMPPGVQPSNSSLAGEHTYFYYYDADNPTDSSLVHFAWVVNRGTLDSITTVFSHELVETCSDPEGTAFQIAPPNSSSWNEIGDSGCGCQGNVTRVNGVLVQKYWSQRDNACVAPAVEPTTRFVVSWASGRLDIFGLGIDGGMFHKSWEDGRAWSPAGNDWEYLSGIFTSPPAVVSWAPGRLDAFGLGTDGGMFHKAWEGDWYPSRSDWEYIGGVFTSPPAAVSWGPRRLDIFGLGLDKAMYHKAWDVDWYPSPTDWERLGGIFTSLPAVVSWAPNRLDIFGLGTDGAMYHKAWDGTWYPSPTDWERLGGIFTSPPAVVSWGPNRLDIFGLGTDGAMYQKAWDGSWYPSPTDWESLGGVFTSPPGVASWGPNRLDIFGLGTDRAMYHKAWAGSWYPSLTDWERLGGIFTAP